MENKNNLIMEEETGQIRLPLDGPWVFSDVPMMPYLMCECGNPSAADLPLWGFAHYYGRTESEHLKSMRPIRFLSFPLSLSFFPLDGIAALTTMIPTYRPFDFIIGANKLCGPWGFVIVRFSSFYNFVE
jgi:hypothetical protein